MRCILVYLFSLGGKYFVDYNIQMEEAEKVRVVVRCRPMSQREISQGHKVAVRVSAEDSSVVLEQVTGKEVSEISMLS